ncbi:MAG: globin domain-containing protein [Paracoccaceae bacterium]
MDNSEARSRAPLTGEQLAVIRKSFALLEDNLETVSGLLYQRLFEIKPDFRPMFRSDIIDQGMRFMSTLRTIVNHLESPESLHPFLVELAEGHAAYGVGPEHFPPMGEALIWTMKKTLGDGMPEGAEEAWRAAYKHVADEMIRLAK